MSSVRVEIMPWLSRYFNDQRSGRVVLDRDVTDGATLRDLLEEIASPNERFKAVLFDPETGSLAAHICLILNGRFLQLMGGLEAKLRPGDTVRVMPAFSGG